MNHLNNCFHLCHCPSGSHKDYLLPCSSGIPVQDCNRHYLLISNLVTYRDLENGSMAIGQGQVYMPHKCSWGKLKFPFLCHHCHDNQFWSASLDLRRLKLWIFFTRHTCTVYDKWEWKIYHWLIKWTWHSLPSPWLLSTIFCQPG